MEPKATIYSKTSCPACGCKKWHPLNPDICYYFSGKAVKSWVPVIDYPSIVPEYDECANCGIVVC